MTASKSFPTKRSVEINGRLIYPFWFRNPHVAERFAARAAMWVILGDAGWYSVCSPGDCERLAKRGYEYPHALGA